MVGQACTDTGGEEEGDDMTCVTVCEQVSLNEGEIWFSCNCTAPGRQPLTDSAYFRKKCQQTFALELVQLAFYRVATRKSNR